MTRARLTITRELGAQPSTSTRTFHSMEVAWHFALGVCEQRGVPGYVEVLHMALAPEAGEIRVPGTEDEPAVVFTVEEYAVQ
jgi:hypothetical protein